MNEYVAFQERHLPYCYQFDFMTQFKLNLKLHSVLFSALDFRALEILILQIFLFEHWL